MPAPTVTIPTQGTNPSVAAKETTESAIDAALKVLWDDIQSRPLAEALGSLAGKSTVDKADLASALSALIDGKAEIADSGKVFGNRAAAVSAGQAALPAALGQIFTREDSMIAVRSALATADDPLFAGAPQWGVIGRLPDTEAVAADMEREVGGAQSALGHDDGRPDADLVSFEDASGNPVQRMDADGMLHLPNLPRPVQSYFGDRPERDILRIEDQEELPLIALREDGQLWVPELEMGVQHATRAATRLTTDFSRWPFERFSNIDMLYLDAARAGAGAPVVIEYFVLLLKARAREQPGRFVFFGGGFEIKG